jgi:hypothetical protein
MMSKRSLLSFLSAAVLFGSVSLVVLHAQRSQSSSGTPSEPAVKSETSADNPCPRFGCNDEVPAATSEGSAPAKPYDWRKSFADYKVGKIQRTADGHPDLQGIWSRTTLVPMQRPRGASDKIDESTAREREDAAQQEQFNLRTEPTDTPPGEKTTDAYNTFWRDGYWFKVPMTSLRTSQVVDPPDGRIPPLTPAAAAAGRERARLAAVLNNRPATSYEDRPSGSRCIQAPGSPGPAFTGSGPGGQESTFQIIEGIDSVIVRGENGRSQLIYLDKRQRPPDRVHLQLGSARGHWEGDTLIVEYTNFGNGNNGEDEEGGSNRERLTARYKRLDDTHLLFGFTREDPGTRTKPYSVEVVFWRLTDQEQLIEYACHEGNVGLEFTLSAARSREYQEAQAEARAKARAQQSK